MYVNNETTPRYYSKQTFRAGDPTTTVLLTFTEYSAGYFTFTLGSAIPTTDVNITYAYVLGYNNSTCTEPWLRQDSLKGTATIPAGSTTVTQAGNSSFSSGGSIIKYKKVDSLTVNGTLYSNGAKFYIGSTYVQLVIDSTTCNTYFI